MRTKKQINWLNLFSPRKVLNALNIELNTLKIIMRYGMPDTMLQFLGGIGDELLLTTVAHEFKKRKDDIRIWQVSHSPELLKYNDDYSQVFDWQHIHLRFSNLLNSRRVNLSYSEQIIPGELEGPPPHHIIAELCRKAGIYGNVEIRPYLYLTEEEKQQGRLYQHQIVLHCVGESSYENVMTNKIWPKERFDTVVRMIKKQKDVLNNTEIIQVGLAEDPYIDGCVDLRGKTSLRETAAIINQSDAFIGTSGLLSHMARAVDCRAVIIYGGREHSYQTGYICNENLDSFLPCAPCWRWNKCDYDRKCMRMITPENVLEALQKVINKKKVPLETETVTIQNKK